MLPLYRFRPGIYLIILLLLWVTTAKGQREHIKIEQPREGIMIPTPDSAHTASRLALGISEARKLRSSNPDSAINLLKQYTIQSYASGYSEGVVQSLFHIGSIYNSMGKYGDALSALRGALNQALPDPSLKSFLPMLLGELSSVYLHQGLYESALHYLYRTAVLIEKDTASPARPGVYTNLGAMLMLIPDNDHPDTMQRILYYFDRAEQIARRKKQYYSLVATLSNKGDFYRRKKEWEKSRHYLSEAYDLARQHNIASMLYNVRIGIGEYHMDRGEYTEALRCMHEAIESERNINPSYAIKTRGLLGNIHFRMKDFDRAEQIWISALEKAQQQQLHTSITELSHFLAELYRETGKDRLAMEHYYRYMRNKDSLAGLEIRHNINRLEVSYRTGLKEKELAGKQEIILSQAQKLAGKNSVIAGLVLIIIFAMIVLALLYRNSRYRRRLEKGQFENIRQKQEIEQLKSIMKGEEKERQRIARELHDGIGGMLAAINMNLGIVQESFPQIWQLPPARKSLELLQETAREVRRTAHNLMPDVLIRHNLREALLIYSEQVGTSGKMKVDVRTHGSLEGINKEAELILYRIVQELVQNAQKHAGEGTLSVQILRQKEMLSIMVEDDGTGFDMDSTPEGMGLKNIRHRVETCRGHVSVTSTPGRGTTVYIELEISRLNLLAAA